MGAAFTADDLVLLGYDEITPIDVSNAAIAYSGKAKAGIVQAEHSFVYVKTDATHEDVSKIARNLRDHESLYILRSKSGPADTVIKSAFGKSVKIYQIEELLWARVNDIFKAYAQSIAQNIPSEPNFIAPRGEDLLPKDRLDNYLIEYFTRDLRNKDKKRLVILKANAGVGKTTLCRRLVKEFARRIDSFKVVPVYVEAAHWGGRVSYESGLWEIIQLSLQNFDPGSGISKNLFEAALKRGLVVFIFDGFDELCSSPRSNVSAKEVIESLREWAEDSEARIILTTRTPFWDIEVGHDPINAYSLSLYPFNPQQAKEYIRKFFEKDQTNFEKARDLYADVIKHATSPDNSGGARAQFWSLPIAVSMICDAVRAGVSAESWKNYSLETLLVAICDRETKRQNLGITGNKQLEVFQEIALLESRKDQNEFLQDDLLAAGVPDIDIGKLASHPLLRVKDEKAFVFTYDFFGPYLRAVAIVKSAQDGLSPIRGSVLEAMRAEENGKGFQAEHTVRLLEGKSGVDVVSRFLSVVPKSDMAARSFLIHILLRLADIDTNVVTNEDRAALLSTALDSEAKKLIFRGVRFTGVVERLDLHDAEFVNCQFEDVSFRNVNFSGCTFRSCSFDGEVEFQSNGDADGFASAELVGDCELRGPARLSLEPLLRRTSIDRNELVKDLLESGLAKFWHNGKFKQTLRKVDWKKGVLGRTRSSDRLLNVLKRNYLIEESTASGVREGVWVFNRDAIVDLQNFMDHRRLTGFVLQAFNDLRSELQ